MIPKLRRRERTLRRGVLNAYRRSLPTSVCQSLPWQMLGRLNRGLPLIPRELQRELSLVVENKSITGYLDLQKYGEPQLYSSPAEYFSVASVLSFLKKFPFGKVEGLDPLGKAEASSVRAEKLCRITNRRLRYFRTRGYRHKLRWRGLHSVFHTARLLISDLLGPLDLNTVYDYTRHGPGGAIGAVGNETTGYFKYSAPSYTVTARALPYAEAAILADPLWRRYVHNPEAILGDAVPSPQDARESVLKRLKVVNHNKVTYVPKTAQTHRAIAIEPLMNIYLQLGVGSFMTDKLRHWGINLRSQARNQMLARVGSTEEIDPLNRPVTLDLSMASDTLAYELVRELLPEDWFSFLDDLRSPGGKYKDVETRWAKFSSMGNGFTFQLETLIFTALVYSVARHLGFSREFISVYGDDIIVPAGMALSVVDVLAYSGFKVNTEKSCFTGHFRESCGTDWFKGTHVRPFYLKRKIQNAKDLIFIYNSYWKMGGFSHPFVPCVNHRIDFCGFVHGFIPVLVSNDLLGPQTEALEGHLFSHLDAASKSKLVKWDMNVQTWSYASVIAVPRTYRGMAGPLYLQLMDRDGSGRDILPERNLGLRRQALSTISELTEPLVLSSVTKRMDVELRLATQTSNGWRND